jgi:hypothetical protein
MNHKVYLSYHSSCSGGGICEGEENESFPNQEDEFNEYTILGVYTKPGNWHEEVDVSFDPAEFIGKQLYIVSVTYTTGDTFGTSYGHVAIKGVFTNQEEAENLCTSINDGTYKGYAEWDGYFESLESVKFESFQLVEGKCPNSTWN